MNLLLAACSKYSIPSVRSMALWQAKHHYGMGGWMISMEILSPVWQM